MCVIAVCLTSRPTNEQVKRMWSANSFGGGVACRETGNVIWEKGLDEKQMIHRARTLPLPFVLHFRKPSEGTSMGKDGCHPFVVNATATADLMGVTEDYVLFHNGYWPGWQDYIFSQKGPIPLGAWSDSRALAMRTAKRGMAFLQILQERVVCFGLTDIQMFGVWKVLPVEGDDPANSGNIFISNNGWERDSCQFSGPLEV